MGHHHLSRREILNSITVLGSGSLLLPWRALYGEGSATSTPGMIRGALRDGATGKPVAAKSVSPMQTRVSPTCQPGPSRACHGEHRHLRSATSMLGETTSWRFLPGATRWRRFAGSATIRLKQ